MRFDEGIENMDPNKIIIEDNDNDEMNALMKEFSITEVSVRESDTAELLLSSMEKRLMQEEAMSTLLEAMKASQKNAFQNVLQQPSQTTIDFKEDKIVDGSATATVAEFHLSDNIARKLLNHQYFTRKKMIHNQRDKSLQDVAHLKRQYLNNDDTVFVPALSSEFFGLMGLSRVVDILKNDDDQHNLGQKRVNFCCQCGTSVSPLWKRDNVEQNGKDDVFCSECSHKNYLEEVRKEYEDFLERTRLQYEEEERTLERDYMDMLASPQKMELFRYEQEKRQKIQELTATHSSRKSSNTSTDLSPSQGSSIVYLRPECDVADTPSVYAHMLKSLVTYISNPEASLDRESLRKLQQVLLLLQTNPLLANNDEAVVQLVSTISGIQGHSVSPGAADVSNILNHMIRAKMDNETQVHSSWSPSL